MDLDYPTVKDFTTNESNVSFNGTIIYVAGVRACRWMERHSCFLNKSIFVNALDCPWVQR